MKTRWFALSAIAVGAGLGVTIAAVRRPAPPLPPPAVRFHYAENGNLAGTEFVCEAEVYTAAHVADGETPDMLVGRDLVRTGASWFWGLDRCRDRHLPGERVTMLRPDWPGEPRVVEGLICGRDEDQDYVARFASEIFKGCSGSPVLCPDGRVLGALVLVGRDPRVGWVCPFGDYRDQPEPEGGLPFVLEIVPR
jgi:hypothetical protein